MGALDGETHSPFADAILAELRTPETTLDQMFEAVQAKVRAATRDEQTPEVFGLGFARSLSFRRGSITAVR